MKLMFQCPQMSGVTSIHVAVLAYCLDILFVKRNKEIRITFVSSAMNSIKKKQDREVQLTVLYIEYT